MSAADTAISAQIHLEGMSDDFLASFGLGFLIVLHKLLISTSSVISLGDYQNNKLTGILICSLNTTQTYKEILLKGFFSLLPYVIKNLVRHPANFIKVFQAVFYPSSQSQYPKSAEILIMAIDKKYRRHGIGSKLISELKTNLASRKIRNLIVSTKKDNRVANAFYKKNGGIFQKTYPIFKTYWNEYFFQQ